MLTYDPVLPSRGRCLGGAGCGRTNAARVDVETLPIPGALLLRPRIFTDERGSFRESFSVERYAAAGIPDRFVQENVSLSRYGVLRGLHGDPRMSKIVQVLAGDAYDVIVDARPGSAAFGTWYGCDLRADEGTQLYIPAGCLHGFLSLADGTVLHYLQSALYDPRSEFGVAWNDPAIGIAWPLATPPILSAKDAANPPLAAHAPPRA